MADGITLTPDGQVYITTDPVGPGSFASAGFYFNAAGQLHVTTTQSPSDVYVDGRRHAMTGELVVGNGNPANRPYFAVNGLPFRKTDNALVRQVNQTPDPTDPYVHGIRVGPLGGVYMVTADVPPTVEAEPFINGQPDVGIATTYTPAVVSDATFVSRVWLLDGVAMPSETGATYTPVLADYGKQLSVQETWTGSGGTVTPVSPSVTIINFYPQAEFDFMTEILDPSLTFTRAGGGATYFDANGVMQTAGANVPRFDHSPFAPYELRGLLIEPTATNLFLNSNSPATQDVTVTAVQHALSFYGTGTITLSGAHDAVLVGTGAYPNRTTLIFTPTAGALTLTLTGVVQMVQLEVAASGMPTSFIATAGAAVTRNGDQLMWTGSTFTSEYNSQEGTVQFNVLNKDTPNNASVVFGQLGTSAFSANRQLGVERFNDSATVRLTDAGTTLAVYSGTLTNALVKMIGAYNYTSNTKSGTAQGANGTSNAKGTAPVGVDRLTIGAAGNFASQFNGWMQQAFYWATSLSMSDMATWTGSDTPIPTPVGTINYFQAWDQTAGPASWVPGSRPAMNLPVQIVNGELSIGGVPSNTLFYQTSGPCNMPKVDSEILATIRRLVSDGVNGMRLRGFDNAWWEESTTVWGWWAHPEDWPTVSERLDVAEPAMVQLDKQVAWMLQEGIDVIYIDMELAGQPLTRGDPPKPLGTYNGWGMYWDPAFNDATWDIWLKLLLRVNTITGLRYCDEPRIMWYSNNEDGFADAYFRNSPTVWGGSTQAYQWFDKIVEGIVDDSGDNGVYYPILNARLTAWRDAHVPGWTIPNWGRGGAPGFPKRDTWEAWPTQTDKDQILDFVAFVEQEWILDRTQKFKALRSDIVFCLGTMSYQSPMATIGLNLPNTLVESHNYFPDANGAGVKQGTTNTRYSVMNGTWSVARNGMNWQGSYGGLRNSVVGFMAGECGQYSPNRWRYQRGYYEMVLACLHGATLALYNQSQQYSSSQFLTDGRYMTGDHVNVASPCDRLVCRAIAPFVRYRFLSQHASAFVINMKPSDEKLWTHANNIPRIGAGSRYNPNFASDGTEHAQWGAQKVFLTYDEGQPTTSFAAYPKVTDTQLTNGLYCRNTATEKVWVQFDFGLQISVPRACGFVDTITESPKFAMPMTISNLAAPAYGFVCFLRSDGPWDLFTDTMKLYIHGSDVSSNVADQGLEGSIYHQGQPSAFGPNNPPGVEYFNSNDNVQVWYSGANSQLWGNGGSDRRHTWLRVPPNFTLNLVTPVDLTITGVASDGSTELLPSQYSGGVWSFDYDGRYAEFMLAPV